MAGSQMDQHKERKKLKNNDNMKKYSTQSKTNSVGQTLTMSTQTGVGKDLII